MRARKEASHKGTAMRHSVGPWFRKSKNAWFVWHEGRQKNLFVKGEANEREAVKAWHRLMAGDDLTPPPMQDPTPTKPTPPAPQRQEPVSPSEPLSSLVKAFMTDCDGRSLKPNTLHGYRTFLAHLCEGFPDTPAEALDKSQLERFSRKPEWSQSYRCGFVCTVVSMFRWAVETGRLDKNPVAGVKKPAKQSRGRKAVISADDHAKLCAKAKGDWKDFLALLWLTGCRPGEVAKLTATDVDLTNGCVILTEHKTAHQTGKDRLIVLPAEAVSILGRLIAARPEGLLFPNRRGRRLTPSAITKRMLALCRRAGVKAIAYGYRHTFATDALASGVPDAHVAALLGHQGTAMLHKHYSHLTSKANVLREALGNVRG